MSSNSLGRESVERMIRLWQVDAHATLATEQGFDWWPGDHKVSVMAQPEDAKGESDVWRLVVRTEYLKGVRLSDHLVQDMLLTLGSFAPTYAWVFTPPEVTRKWNLADEGLVHLQSTVYLRPDTANWLTDFFARVALMQPIDAQRLAPAHAATVNAAAHQSRHPALKRPQGLAEDILSVAHEHYVPLGQEPSRWLGSREFERVAEQFGRQDMCFGNGGDAGLSLETTIGDSSALVRCHADIPHPSLGNGLLSSVTLPFWKERADIVDESMWLNYFESVSWTNVPQLGSWHPREVRKGRFMSANGFFIPNALYAPGIATNCALWRLGLARWAKDALWPDLEDKTMLEVMKKRLGEE